MITTDMAVLKERYPSLFEYSVPVMTPERDIVGRDKEMRQILAALSRPELSNVLLLAPAGTGKSALVQGLMMVDPDRIYLEVDMARMAVEDVNGAVLAGRLKGLVDEAELYSKTENHELVLFMDELHQVVKLSDAATDALKPILATSGTRGIRVIAATTFEEYHEFIASNLPLVERLQQIKLSAPDKDTVIDILRGMAKRYGVDRLFYDNTLFELIYEYTNRYIPASAQPRKSILVLDSMVGWHRFDGRKFDKKLLADVLYESTGVNVAFRVDAVNIENELNKRIIAQDPATHLVARQLQLCVADLNDPMKPMSSFLFAGSSGVGKTELTKTLAKLLFGNDRNNMIRFDMTEYALDDSMDRFRTELTQAVADYPYSVLLLDEVEKASSMVTRLLLQVLDDGRLSDVNGRQVSFLNCYIVMTSNAGAGIFANLARYGIDGKVDDMDLSGYQKLIRQDLINGEGNKFPAELLGRIDVIVPFRPLGRESQRQILKMKMSDLGKLLLEKHGVTMRVHSDVLTYFIEDIADVDTNAGGARGIIVKFTQEMVNEIATVLNADPTIDAIQVQVKGKMRAGNDDVRSTQAHIEVVPTAWR